MNNRLPLGLVSSLLNDKEFQDFVADVAKRAARIERNRILRAFAEVSCPYDDQSDFDWDTTIAKVLDVVDESLLKEQLPETQGEIHDD